MKLAYLAVILCGLGLAVGSVYLVISGGSEPAAGMP